MKLSRALLALALCGCAFAALADPVSFADLAKHSQYKNVKISPDGKYLAATAVIKKQTMLVLVDLQTMKGNTIRPRDEDDVIDFWWASPTRVVYDVGLHWGGYDTPLSTGELFAVNADGGSADMLYGLRKEGMETGTHIDHAVAEKGSAQFIAAIPGDPNHALVAISDWDSAGNEGALPIAYKMDLRDGQKVRLVASPVRNTRFLADHKGNIRLVFGSDINGNIKIYERPVGGGDWQLLQQASDDRDRPISFSADDSVAYFSCAAPGGFGVCKWDPASKKMDLLWSNPDVEATGLMEGPAKDQFIGVRFDDGRPGAALFDSKSADAQTLISLMQQFPGEAVNFISGGVDGSKSILYVDADVDPGTFYLFDRDAKKLTALLKNAAWIKPAQMASKQPFEFAARDGLKLHGYISYPPGQENAKHLPMVVYVHGGPSDRDYWYFDSDVQALATRGYAVLQVNFRGSSGHGYDFEKAGWGEWGGKMQDDVTDATRWAIAQGVADPNRICIYGASYGGYAALEGAVKEPNLYKCAVGYVGVYDLPMLYSRGDARLSTSGENSLKRQVGTDMTSLAQHSPIHQLSSLKAKVMLIVGGKDETVPEVQGNDMHMALLANKIPHEWLYEPDEMHGFYKEEHITEVYTKVDAFLDANIGAGAGSATISSAAH